jgi:beta-lactamase class A
VSWHDAVTAYLAGRAGTVTVAVEDLLHGRSYQVARTVRVCTASIVKVEILEALLHERGGVLTARERSLATAMIERSDNDAATKLWDRLDGAVDGFNATAGLTQTTLGPGGYWGGTTSSAADQVAVLRLLARPNRLLTRESRSYALALMSNVVPEQRWGVSAGVPDGASVALKNGWYPAYDNRHDWRVNSVGYVHGAGCRYLIAVLTMHDPSMAYGVETVEHVAALTAAALAPESWVFSG